MCAGGLYALFIIIIGRVSYIHALWCAFCYMCATCVKFTLKVPVYGLGMDSWQRLGICSKLARRLHILQVEIIIVTIFFVFFCIR